MANGPRYRFSRGKGRYITFDSKGYIVEAKGFNDLMWSSSLNVDEDIIGKHIDELAEMLEKNGKENEYLKFEAYVHVGLLKKILQNTNQ